MKAQIFIHFHLLWAGKDFTHIPHTHTLSPSAIKERKFLGNETKKEIYIKKNRENSLTERTRGKKSKKNVAGNFLISLVFLLLRKFFRI